MDMDVTQHEMSKECFDVEKLSTTWKQEGQDEELLNESSIPLTASSLSCLL